MNTTTRTAFRLLVATPLAAAALTLGAGVAQADGEALDFKIAPGVVEPQGPGDIAHPEPEEDPKPQGPGEITNPEDDEDPKPDGPGEITNPEDDDDPKPDGPGEITNPEDDDPKPHGPDDKAAPQPGDQPEDQPADQPGDEPAGKPAAKPLAQPQGSPEDRRDASAATEVGVPLPSRIDAGAVPVEDEGLQLAWLLAGGGLVTAAGSILARQRLAGRRTR